MVGVVLVTHPNLGEEFMRSAEMICGKIPRVVTVSIDTRREAEELRRGVAEAIRKADEGDGVLILTDMFGGTPSNMSLAFLQENRVEVLTGLNLPMMIKLANCREARPLKELARKIRDAGQKNISLASEILQKKS